MFGRLSSLTRRSRRFSAAELCLWTACVVCVVGGVIALVAPAGGTNRVAGVAVALGLGAAAQAGNALTQRPGGRLSLALYVAAALAVLYAIILALSLPLRLTIEGHCQPAPAPCPLGFDLPITAGENTAVYATVICGVLALVISFVAAELQFRPRRPRRDPDRADRPA